MKLVLVRVGQSEQGTFGVLRAGQVPFALTLEEPWLDNNQHISCIPIGQYVCHRVYSPKFGETFEVSNVPQRTHILFHKGNTLHDTAGCILIGEEFGVSLGKPFLAASERGYKEFMTLLTGQHSFELEIVHVA